MFFNSNHTFLQRKIKFLHFHLLFFFLFLELFVSGRAVWAPATWVFAQGSAAEASLLSPYRESSYNGLPAWNLLIVRPSHKENSYVMAGLHRIQTVHNLFKNQLSNAVTIKKI